VTQRALSLAIVGIDYPNKRGPGRRFELEICRPGEPIELRPEPNNQFDEHAIAVFSCRGIQLGYLASERAVFIGTLWRQKHQTRAIFQALEAKVGWLRVAFDGEEPVLPPLTTSKPAAGADGFWPDEIYPDD
jgi:hypothetical protein